MHKTVSTANTRQESNDKRSSLQKAAFGLTREYSIRRLDAWTCVASPRKLHSARPSVASVWASNYAGDDTIYARTWDLDNKFFYSNQARNVVIRFAVCLVLNILRLCQMRKGWYLTYWAMFDP